MRQVGAILSDKGAPRHSRFRSEHNNCEGCNGLWVCNEAGKYATWCTTYADGTHTNCEGDCTNSQAGEYYTSASKTYDNNNQGVAATGCEVADCTNALAVGEYYSGSGGASATGCPVGNCTNAAADEYYISVANPKNSTTGCSVADCTVVCRSPETWQRSELCGAP